MTIRPIDFQISVPRTTEISKINAEDTQRNLAAQQQQATSTQMQADNSVKLVHTQEKTQEALIREKQEKERRERENKNKKKSSDDSKAGHKDVKGEQKSSYIDIRL